jgi:Protein of unknown function (DUF229)
MFAALTGQSPFKKHIGCNPTGKGFLDNCHFIWKEYQKHGYVTFYAEDQRNYSTFNIQHKGFKKQPTDHYFRPFVLAGEKHLKIVPKDKLAFCLADSIYFDHILVYGMKLASIHHDDPFFGLIYINSFSHKLISTAAVIDKRLAESFIDTLDTDFSNDTIFIYFSDTGMRFEENEVKNEN